MSEILLVEPTTETLEAHENYPGEAGLKKWLDHMDQYTSGQSADFNEQFITTLSAFCPKAEFIEAFTYTVEQFEKMRFKA